MAKKPTTKKLIELANQYAGCRKDVAKACNVSPQTIHNWMVNDPEFKTAMDDGNNVLVDLAIQGLRHHLENNSEKSIHYTLDRLARDKGFGMFLQVKDKSRIDEHLDEMSDEEIIAEMERSRNRIKKAE